MPISTLDDARTLMHEWVANPALRVHMEAVAACMRSYAATLDPSQAERWAIAGLLHDFDYEKHPNHHPQVGVEHLRELGVDSEVIDAILGHASERTGVARTTPMARTLFAVDELAGFIVACAKIRPDGLATLEPKSVQKKLKTPSFAAAVSRDDIASGIRELAVDEQQHIQRCIDAIRDAGLR